MVTGTVHFTANPIVFGANIGRPTMQRTYDATITIDNHEGYMECPAVFEVCNDFASLLSFKIGARQFSLQDAIAMTGVEHVSSQELAVWAKWLDETRDDWTLEAAE